MALADPNELWPELEKLGETEVRRRLTLNTYGHTKLPAVEAWLRLKAEERAASAAATQDSQRAEELRILSSTKNAAWIAAVAALLSMVAAGVALYHSWK